MVTLTFLRKELAEHWLAISALTIAVMYALFITLTRYQNQEFSISPLEILSFSLYTFIPLSAFVLSNLLIVRDYKSRAQQYTESLPTRRITPVLVKYLLGGFIVCGLMLITLLMASRYASVVDSITSEYFSLLALKTLSVAALYWAVMFTISLSGHLRLLLYVLLIGSIYYLLTSASIDITEFGPFALLMDGTLAYERVDVPVRALQETWALTLAFTLVGFIIALWQEGSMAEVLARPMARRDYIVAGFIVAAFLTVLSVLEKEPLPEPLEVSTRFQLNSDRHNITVAYLDPDIANTAQPLLDGLDNDIDTIQAKIGPLPLAPAYVVHDTDLASWEFVAHSADGPLVYGNFTEADHYDRVVFRTTVMHQLLLGTSGGRSVFEHYHWFLDGYTRRVTEASTAASTQDERDANHEELLARALISLEVLGDKTDLINDWQIIADRVGYASAESMAYSALVYLEQQQSSDVIDELAKRWLATRSVRDTRASFQRWKQGAEIEFRNVTSFNWAEFMAGWQDWLKQTESRPEVARRLTAVPYRAGAVYKVDSEIDGSLLLGSFATRADALPNPNDFKVPETSANIIGNDIAIEQNTSELVCILNYEPTGPFDTEMDFVFDDFREEPCADVPFTMFDYNLSGAGSRTYLTVEVRSAAFHQPIRLHAERITSQ